MDHRAASLVLAALALVGCVGGHTESTIIGTIGEPESVKPAVSAVLTNGKNDLVDANGKKANPQPIIDITELNAMSDGTGSLQLGLTVAGDIPATLSSTAREVTYAIVIEADGSGDEDYALLVTNGEQGRWSVALTDYSAGKTLAGDREFSGVSGHHIALDVALTDLGSPSSLRISAIAQVADHKTGKVIAEDQVPEGEQHRPDASWLTLTP
jgi:hypothetical protein